MTYYFDFKNSSILLNNHLYNGLDYLFQLNFLSKIFDTNLYALVSSNPMVKNKGGG